MNGREVSVIIKSGTCRPHCRCSGSPGKHPQKKDGFGVVLSNLKNSKDKPSQRMQQIAKEKPCLALLMSQPED
jgi:hypothetical protein